MSTPYLRAVWNRSEPSLYPADNGPLFQEEVGGLYPMSEAMADLAKSRQQANA